MSEAVPCTACGEPATKRLHVVGWTVCTHHLDMLLGAVLCLAAIVITIAAALFGVIL